MNITFIIGMALGLFISTMFLIQMANNDIKESKKHTLQSQQNFGSLLKKTQFPIISFSNNGIDLNFIIDTAAEASCFNSVNLSKLNYTSTGKSNDVAGIEGIASSCWEGQMILNDKQGRNFTLDFYAKDFSNALNQLSKSIDVRLDGLIGNDFLQKYKSTIDFDKMIIYLKVKK